ncbi:hypothetical protein ACFVTT_24090 [Streptomyces niveus]|uniref:hypothetical protein n=1 Tax=Streptomyces niveus TaxID=193462 RepID=UPI00342F31A4
MKPPLPDAGTVREAMDAVLAEAIANGRRATVSAVERRLGITHATFYRHYQDLITTHFQARLPAMPKASSTPHNERAGDNLRRLRRENANLRATLHLYEEAIRQLTLENHALRERGTVSVLPVR